MDIETKNKWSAELRSDRYVKINGSFSNACNGRCVLGVLGEVYEQDVSQIEQFYDYLKLQRVDFRYFYGLNDSQQWLRSFHDLADLIDATPIDDPVFNCDTQDD